MNELDKHYHAYHSQKARAKRCGIGWEFTLETWLAWWGEDIVRRGRGHDQLQMQRVGDVGPYEPSNVRKGYPMDNAKTVGKNYRHRKSLKARADIERRMDVAPAVPRKPTAYQQQGEAVQDHLSGRESHFIDRMFRPKSSFGRF